TAVLLEIYFAVEPLLFQSRIRRDHLLNARRYFFGSGQFDVHTATGCEAAVVGEADRIALHEAIEVRAINGTRRVATEPVTDPRYVVAVGERVNPRCVVALFRRERFFLKPVVAQLVASDEARTAVGEVLFVADDGTVFIELEARRAELVV